MEQGIIATIQSVLEPLFAFENPRNKLIASAIVIVSLWLLRLVVLRLVYRRVKSVEARYWWQKGTSYAAISLGLVIVGSIWITAIQSVATFLGLLAAGLAIALQSPITDIAGWAFILMRRPFEVGDRIQIGDNIGDVIDLRFFQFSLLEIGNWVDADQSTGRIMHVPNKKIFDEILTNYSQGFDYIWNEVPVLVTFESEWQKAKAILQEVANRRAAALSPDAEEQFRQATRRYMIAYETQLEPIVYTTVEASGVLLTIRYLCEYDQRRVSEHAIWEDILQAFAQEPSIEFAYPTQRFYNDWVERLGQSPYDDRSSSS